jgi:hypothetical protein
MEYTGGTLAGWQPVGPKGFNGSTATEPTIAFDTNTNMPFVVYRDGVSKPVVQYYDGGWSPLGNLSGLITNGIDYPTIAVDSTGAPYAAFEDFDNSQKVTVTKWANPNWVYVGGNPGISTGAAFYINLALDKNNVPYVAYADLSNSTGVVKKFSGGSWSDVGPAFSAVSVNAVSLALDSSNVPYVAYTEQSANKSSVKKYNSSTNSWDSVGTQYISASQATRIVLALDGSNTPYIAFQDFSVGSVGNNPISVMKLSGGNWVYVGGAGISANVVGYLSMTTDKGGSPLVFFGDLNAANNYASVLKFDGTNWNFLGGQFFSDGASANGRIALDANGVPTVVYQDRTTANHSGITVEKYNQTTAVNVSGLRTGTVTTTKVQLKWQTQAETLLSGFDVWRQPGKGEFKQVNAKFIQAKFSGAPDGASYAFTDKSVKPGKTYHYKLRVSYLDGRTEWTKELVVKTP